MLWCIGIEDVFYFVRGSAFEDRLGGALGCLRFVVSYVSHFHYNFWGGRVGAVVGFEWGRVWVF